MAANAQRPSLVVIVGPTGSGKSELAMRIARSFSGEIIAADSRTIYKDLDIGTAKPSKNDQQEVRHWGLDLIEPGERYSVKEFKNYALMAIEDIRRRDKLPILTGGTGLYVDAVVFDFNFRSTDKTQRDRLEKLNVQDLQVEIVDNGLPMPANQANRRHLIRVLESGGEDATRVDEPAPGTLMVGIDPAKEVLAERLKRRGEGYFKNGLIAEAKKAKDKYGFHVDLPGIPYKLAAQIIDGQINESAAKDKLLVLERQYARRQRTWFKRNKFILWFSDIDTAEQAVEQALNN